MSNTICECEKIITELEQEKKKLNMIANLSANLIFEYHIKDKSMHWINQNTEWILEPITKDFKQNLLSDDAVWHEDKEIAEKFCDELEAGKETITAEYRRKFLDGSYHYIEVKAKTIYDEKKEPQLVLGKLSDINERKLKELHLEKMSKIDCLTELYNKNTVKKLIVNSLEVKNEVGTKALFVIDIDFFKEINDSYGHLFGDAVICSVADEMRHIFPKNAILGRIGGDEFIAYMEDISLDLAHECAQNLCHNIRSIYEKKEEESKIKVSCSIGIALASEEKKRYEDLFQEADKALYYVKSIGKGSYEIYEGSEKYEKNCVQETQQYLDFRSLTEESCQIDNSMHNLLLFSIELLEKVKESDHAIQMILDRVGRYFSLQEIHLIAGNEKGAQDIHFQWLKRGRSPFKTRKVAYSFQQIEHILSRYDEFGMAILTKEDLRIKDAYEPEMETILTARGNLDEFTIGDIAFLDSSKNRIWTVEEKTVIKGLATLLYAYLAKTNAIESTKRAEYLLRYDAVTGLPNYGTFKEMVEDIINKNPDKQYAITYSGFSNFQYVNDTFGYAVGDAVLTRFAKVLKEECTTAICCARITGDQFVSLYSFDDFEATKNEYIAGCKRFCKIMEVEIGIINLIIYSGIAKVERKKNHQVAIAIDQANLARKLIRGKAETDCLVFTKQLKKTMDDRIKITANMATALEKEEFKVYLQPKSELKTGEIVGAEALVRWQKKDGTIICPDEFIPIFEENGFVTQIDFYVLQRVLIYLKNRMEKGLAIVPISVNFSRRHQENEHFVSDIIALLEEYRIPTSCIEVEVTESVFMSNLEMLHSNVKRLKENGIRISIDDFGSGYSSLNVLASVPADVIKIDKIFLWNDDEMHRKILKHLIAMIKKLELQVIVEGVETEEQVKMLLKTECDMIQGYFFARPMPMEEFSELL